MNTYIFTKHPITDTKAVELIDELEYPVFYTKIDCVENVDPDDYFISSCGDVITSDNTYLQHHKNSDGYHQVTLYTKNGKKKTVKVHRLVGESFVPRDEIDELRNRNSVCFVDGDKDNISMFNLIWLNSEEILLKQTIKELLKGREFFDSSCLECLKPYIAKLIDKGYDRKEINHVLNLNIGIFAFFFFKRRLKKESKNRDK